MRLRRKLRWMNAGVIFSAFMVIGISGMSIIGYLSGNEWLWKWTADGGSMGINTAVTLLCIGVYMFINGYGISKIIEHING